jgi:hypothetical protein
MLVERSRVRQLRGLAGSGVECEEDRVEAPRSRNFPSEQGVTYADPLGRTGPHGHVLGDLDPRERIGRLQTTRISRQPGLDARRRDASPDALPVSHEAGETL